MLINVAPTVMLFKLVAFHSNGCASCELYSSPEGVTFVSSPNTRGTLNILWSCLGTLVLCRWSVLKVDIRPGPGELLPKEEEDALNGQFSMLKAILFPENLLSNALHDLLITRHNKKLQAWAKIDGVGWSLTHAFFANMGGYVLRYSNNNDDNVGDWRTPPIENMAQEPLVGQQGDINNSVTSTHNLHDERVVEEEDAMISIMEELPLLRQRNTSNNSAISTHKNLRDEWRLDQEAISQRQVSDNIQGHRRNVVKTLNAKQLLIARKEGILDRMPNVSKSKLEDLSKTDNSAQLLAVGQVIWLVLTCFCVG